MPLLSQTYKKKRDKSCALSGTDDFITHRKSFSQPYLDFLRSNELGFLFVRQIVKRQCVDFLECNFHLFLKYLLQAQNQT